MAFSDIFSGDAGLIKSLANVLGGTANVVFRSQGQYDPATDSQHTEESRVAVGWFPSPQNQNVGASYVPSRGGFGMAGGLMTEKSDIAGKIPYCDLAAHPEITPNRDLIIVDGVAYTIKKVSCEYVQNAKVAVAIEADR